jgi:hypothetical protein
MRAAGMMVVTASHLPQRSFSHQKVRFHARYFDRRRPKPSKGVAMPQTHQRSHSETLMHPTCLKCRAPMRLIMSEDKYPGYHRRTFECIACDATVTEWAGISPRGAKADHGDAA